MSFYICSPPFADIRINHGARIKKRKSKAESNQLFQQSQPVQSAQGCDFQSGSIEGNMTGQEMFSAIQVLIRENSLLTNSRDAGWLAGIGRFLDKIFSH